MKKSTKLILAIGAGLIVVIFTVFHFTDPSREPVTETAPTSSIGDNDDHGDDHDEGGEIEMTATERAAKGVKTSAVSLKSLSDEVVVPGEVTLDLYRSTQIVPRISAQVVERHAKLGDHVKRGQRLVTLSSIEMADAQGALIVSTREWQRVGNLGRDVVSERRYVEAQVAAEQARAKVVAFGMTPAQADALLKADDASKATGTFDLLAPQNGTIVSDNFVVGEVVEPGRKLLQITDESRVWVRAQLAPAQATHITVGAPVRVLIDSGHSLAGKVVQVYHAIDETTRTLPIRVEVENEGDELHPGQFVNVAINVGKENETLAVPETAVILMGGVSTVFKVEGDELHPIEIQVGERREGWIEVTSGLTTDDEIAVTEVFLLKSLIQKSEMGEGHGH